MHPTRIFKKPEELSKVWEEYKVDMDKESVKWTKIQYVGKDGERVTDNPPMPYDMDGFASWHKNKYNKVIHQYIENQDGLYDDFMGIVTHMKMERNANIKTGVLLGFFNASMGNRIVGLAERNETNVNANVNILNLDPLDDSADNGTP